MSSSQLMWRPRVRPSQKPCAGTVPSSTPPHASREASQCSVRSVGGRQIARETSAVPISRHHLRSRSA